MQRTSEDENSKGWKCTFKNMISFIPEVQGRGEGEPGADPEKNIDSG